MEESVQQEEKICTRCGDSQSYDQFSQKASSSYQSWCITCTNTWKRENYQRYKTTHASWTPSAKLNVNLKLLYGITLEQYNAMLEDQGGVCAICKLAETRIDKRTKTIARLTVDHSHITGAVRSLLCQRCNVTVGILETNLEQIDIYLQYIQKHSV